MLSNNVIRNVLLPRNKNKLYKRYDLSQITCNVRNKRSLVTRKDQPTIMETDDEDDRPIKYSQSKAATMKINEYRNPYGDTPSYQSKVISMSLAIFLIYFCILREENDIDLMLSRELGDHFENLQPRK